ncbi:YggS family pyridoxal phosphate-dependent enzyme [Leadbetterella sp. DM7]|uniref:YggS family pyridoxal phosphate-dependent enzyme n=1 Tax=Leadbetterella sp. DM7 TaxID=3235085 RepID=UPI00349E5DBB
MIADRIRQLKNDLPGHVKLVAVSKFKPAADIMEAYAAGQRDFGENYVQEVVSKSAELPADIRWHFIGHLQTNKVKYIAPFVHLVHSVDSLKLLKEINKQAGNYNRVIECLLQVHIAQEETKSGLTEEELLALLEAPVFGEMRHVKVTGVMGMSTLTDDPAVVRAEFRALKNIFEKGQRLLPGMKEISMGMSGDWPVAVEEGSTMVRIGSTIFGTRNQK